MTYFQIFVQKSMVQNIGPLGLHIESHQTWVYRRL